MSNTPSSLETEGGPQVSCPPSPAYNQQTRVVSLAERLARARSINQVDINLKAILDSNTRAFFEVFSRQIQLIKSRLPDLDGDRVTVFDRVLLLLTNDGVELNTAPAIMYFFEEFLGISANSETRCKYEVF